MGNASKTAALLAALSALLLFIGQLLGGQTGMTVALVTAIAMNFGSYWFTDKIVLRMYIAREVGPEPPSPDAPMAWPARRGRSRPRHGRLPFRRER